ncbi:isatin hydrolase [Patella vulgata]|uniref:isatin hydrolase n=1 Tax=Patella vulgata TaxID=6465 RepID=UPI00218005BF|nr:isatin hydrolase [Patella vulgata]XP_055958544.1 isatin hydrolase [Patella vulgata]
MKNLAVLTMITVCCCVNGKTIIDMSYELGPNSTSWPNNPPFNMTPIVRGNQTGGFWLEYNWFATNEHRSTHIDAPSHFFYGSQRVHQIPLENLIGPGIVLRAREEAKNNSDFAINKDFIVKWEARNGRIPEKAIVLMDFDWGKRYVNLDNNLIFNTETYENTSTYHFPGIAPDAMTYLVMERHIITIGTDTTSLDIGQSTDYPCHIICGRNNITIIENVANLDKIPIKGSTVFVAPLKLNEGSGTPTRVFAIFDEEPPTCKPSNMAKNINQLSRILLFFVFIIVNIN